MNNVKRIYDGATFCKDCDCGQCPVVDYNTQTGMVTLSDPAKPQNGTFTMTVQEFNTLLGNAPRIDQ